MRLSPELERIIEELSEQPEARRLFIRALMIEDLLEVPERLEAVRQLFQQVDQRIEALEQRTAAGFADMQSIFAEAFQRLDAIDKKYDQKTQELSDKIDERYEALDKKIDERYEALDKKIDDVRTELKGDITRLDKKIDDVRTELKGDIEDLRGEMNQRFHRVERDLGLLKGQYMEIQYERKLAGVLGQYFRKVRKLTIDEIVERLDPTAPLTDEEEADLARADLLAEGIRKADKQPVIFVIEVSWGVGVQDVRRASQRAEYLTRRGMRAIGLIAGETITPKAEAEALRSKVLVALGTVLRDGRAVLEL